MIWKENRQTREFTPTARTADADVGPDKQSVVAQVAAVEELPKQRRLAVPGGRVREGERVQLGVGV